MTSVAIKNDPSSFLDDNDISGGDPPSRRIKLPENFDTLDREALLGLWNEQDSYIDQLEATLRECESKNKNSDPAISRREHLLVVRLAAKDQEIQELTNQISELKSAQIPSSSALRNTLIDPAVNVIILKLKNELDATKTKMQETQEELNAWKFTPDSVTGKRLMSKCRQLLQENEEIGKMISSGRLAKLEGELSMQKNLCEEMKKNQAEMDDFIQELDEDVEGMQSTIYFLQQQLKESKETIQNLQRQLADHKVPLSSEAEPEIEKRPADVEDSKQLVEESQQAGAEDEVEEEDAMDQESTETQAASSRGGRGGRKTPVKSRTPSKRGRGARGQKREPDEDESTATAASGRGRPKRRRGTTAKTDAPDEEDDC